jgi:hypothetical protein
MCIGLRFADRGDVADRTQDSRHRSSRTRILAAKELELQRYLSPARIEELLAASGPLARSR